MKSLLFLLTMLGFWGLPRAWSNSPRGGPIAGPLGSPALAFRELRGETVVGSRGEGRSFGGPWASSSKRCGEAAGLPGLLRLKGGKVKFKNLREVKQRREMEDAAAQGREIAAKKKHRGGGKVKKKMPPSKPGMFVGGTAPQQTVEGDDLGIDEWAAKGKNIYYGAERDLSDEEKMEEQYDMEEAEAKRMMNIMSKREGQKVVVEEPQAVDGLVAEDQAFPDDSSGEYDEQVAPAKRGQMKPLASGISFASAVTGGRPNLLAETEGIEMILEEVEIACQTLRVYIEPLVFACEARSDVQGPGRALLMLKYQSLMTYVIELQSFAISRIDGEWTTSHPVNARVERAWAKLEVMKMLESRHAGDVTDLISELRGEGLSLEGPKAKMAALAAAVAPKPQKVQAVTPKTRFRNKAKAKEAEREEENRKRYEYQVMIDKGIEDADAASWKGFKHWDELYQKALRLEEKEKRGYTEPDEEQQRAISRKNYYRAMYMLAYQRVYPPAVGEHRRPSGGAMIVLEGGRKPASYEILTNTGDVIRQLQKRRSRRYSNPRLRLRHKFHDLINNSRGSTRFVDDGGKDRSYAGEKSGVNPKAKHSVSYRMV